MSITPSSSRRLLWRGFVACRLLADIEVLAKHATQVAPAEEDRPRAAAAAQTVLFAAMGEIARNARIATRFASGGLIGQAVDATVARAGVASRQFLDREIGASP